MSVREAYEQEKPKLLPLPETTFPTDERVEVHVGKTPYVRFDKNDYTVPHTHVRRTLVVVASPDTVRVLDGQDVIATHPRTYDKGAQVEDPQHIEALVAAKRQGRRHRAMDRLHHAAPHSRALLVAMAERGGNIGSATAALMRLLDTYGGPALDPAIAEAVERGTPHPQAVRQVLERRRQEQGAPPPVAVRLPDNKRVRGIAVRPHDLKAYDAIKEAFDDDDQ